MKNVVLYQQHCCKLTTANVLYKKKSIMVGEVETQGIINRVETKQKEIAFR